MILSNDKKNFDNVGLLFRFLHSSDYFEATYITLLSNRLLEFNFDLQQEISVLEIFKAESSESFKSITD